MATTVFSARFGHQSPSYGPDSPTEPNQTIVAADGIKQIIPYHVWFDSDGAYNATTGEYVIPRTGIYCINFQMKGINVPTTTSGLTYIYANGTEIAKGDNVNSTGTDPGSPTASYCACLEGGTVITFRAAYNNNPHAYGYVALYQVPDTPFSIADYLSQPAPNDGEIPWDPICDQPSWIDPGDTTKIVVDQTGYYCITYKDVIDPSGVVDFPRYTYLYVNGSFYGINVANPQGATNIPLNVTIHLTAGDYIQMFQQIDTASVVDTTANIFLFKVPGTFHGALAYKDTKTIATGAFVPVDFDSTLYDTDGYWSGGAPEFLTIPSGMDGRYLCWAGFASQIYRGVNWEFLTNTVQYQTGGTGNGLGLNRWLSPTSFAIWDLVAGDQLELQVETGDTPYTLRFSQMGLMKIDDWDYSVLSGCPCPVAPGGFPRIYRRLAIG